MRCQALLPPVLDLDFVLRGPKGTGWAMPPEPGEVEIAAEAPIRHAEPVGLVALASWVDRLRRTGSSIIIAESAKSRYAWSTGILTALAGKSPFCEDVKMADEWFPLCRAASEPIIDKLGGQVGVLLNIPTRDAKEALAYTISEMVRNAHEHRRTDCPIFFAAGWFRRQERLTFAVADAGVGIPGSLRIARRTTEQDDDAEAIERALQPYMTGAAAPDDLGAPGNAGLGLYMTRRIVASCGGEFLVQSFGARFLERGGENGAFAPCGVWKGTLVQVTLRLHQMPSFSALFQSLVAQNPGEVAWTIQFSAGPKEATDFFPPVDQAGFAASKGWFAEQRARVREELEEGGMVVIDFKDARFTTQSAVHAMLYEPLRVLGPRVLADLWFANASPQIRAVVRQVVSYALEHYEANRSRSGDGSTLP